MPTVYLEYKKGTIVPVYICNLDKHDNDLFEKQIRECGDVQSKKTNVKADMTEWLLTEYESFRNLGIDIVVNHLPHLNKPTISKIIIFTKRVEEINIIMIFLPYY